MSLKKHIEINFDVLELDMIEATDMKAAVDAIHKIRPRIRRVAEAYGKASGILEPQYEWKCAGYPDMNRETVTLHFGADIYNEDGERESSIARYVSFPVDWLYRNDWIGQAQDLIARNKLAMAEYNLKYVNDSIADAQKRIQQLSKSAENYNQIISQYSAVD